ncbi:MAG: hypothetical protein RLY93_12415 [Sumerlaeia bacterium]
MMKRSNATRAFVRALTDTDEHGDAQYLQRVEAAAQEVLETEEELSGPKGDLDMNEAVSALRRGYGPSVTVGTIEPQVTSGRLTRDADAHRAAIERAQAVNRAAATTIALAAAGAGAAALSGGTFGVPQVVALIRQVGDVLLGNLTGE